MKHLLLALLLTSCATTPSDGAKIVDEVSDNCMEVANLKAMGFSFVPPVATMVAKEMLINKAKDFHANTVVINETRGMFQVDIDATGYSCPEGN